MTGHHHSEARRDYGRAFALGIALNLLYVAGEAAAGVLSGSLALIADAGHNLADVLGLALSWGAAVLSRGEPNRRFTYGLGSSSILAALANALILLAVTGGIAWEAVLRLAHPAPVASDVMIAAGAAGILVNGVTALLFMTGRHHDLNLKSAFLHMAADTLVTVSVVGVGIAIRFTHASWLDPAASLAVSAVIVAGAWGLVRSALALALDAVPEEIDAAAVRTHLASLPGVAALHDLHIWGMSTTETALTCHLIMPGGHPGDAMLGRIAKELHDRFGIAHATIQIELADTDETCALLPEHVV
jgi:cobalt-zinc-cadmium efflux system protein